MVMCAMEEYLQKIGAKARIRDPLYGFIPLTQRELKIIDTPLFQRLRRVHQLALTKYVYPSAEHSRFVHSLGVLHCATLIMAGVFEHRLTRRVNTPGPELIKTLRYAALLHDIGHLPFSHAVEEYWLNGLSHEDLSIFIIENYPPIKNILEEDDVKTKEVASLLRKNPPSWLRIYHEIVSGQLDADRADYLLRDSHCCGVKYGEYDFHRFLQIFAAQHDDNGVFTLCVDEKDLPIAESLLVARYHYNLQIPYHRTRSGFDFALKAFARKYTNYSNIFKISNRELETVDFDSFALLDDGTIMNEVKERYRSGDYWARCLMREEHLTPLIDTNSMSESGQNKFKSAVLGLNKSENLEADEDYFVQERTVDMIKRTASGPSQEADNEDELNQAGTIRLISKEKEGSEGEAVNIRRRSWIFGQLDKDPYIIYRIYCKQDKKEECLRIIDSSLE